MEVIVSFIFELLKIVILSTVYGSIIFVFLQLVFKRKLKLKIWLFASAFILVNMVIYRNTHWGNHGLGDSRRIPLQYGKEINQLNGNWTYIHINNNKTIPITEFALTNDYVIGLTGIDGIESYPKYFAWNYKTDSIYFYGTKAELNARTPIGKVKLMPFHKHYYWCFGGWKFWLLP